MTIAYFSPTELFVLSGEMSGRRIKVKKLQREELPENLMRGGIIQDKDAMKEFLRYVKRQSGSPLRSSAALVLESRMMFGKRIDVPSVSQKKLNEIVKNEFMSLDTGYENMLFGYTEMPKNGEGSSVLAFATDRGYIGDYVDTFKEAGIQIDGVACGMNTLIMLADFLMDSSDKTYVFVYLNDRDMTLLLFSGGAFEMMNKMTMQGDRDDAQQFASALLQNISSMLRFRQTQTGETPVSGVHICGLRESELTVCENLSRILDIPVANIDPGAKIRIPVSGITQKNTQWYEAAYPIGALLGS